MAIIKKIVPGFGFGLWVGAKFCLEGIVGMCCLILYHCWVLRFGTNGGDGVCVFMYTMKVLFVFVYVYVVCFTVGVGLILLFSDGISLVT